MGNINNRMEMYINIVLRQSFRPFYIHIKLCYERNKYPIQGYAVYSRYYGFKSLSYWIRDILREYIDYKHHRNEVDIYVNPQRYFTTWEGEFVRFFLSIYSKELHDFQHPKTQSFKRLSKLFVIHNIGISNQIDSRRKVCNDLVWKTINQSALP
jgi:hypothetical protein